MDVECKAYHMKEESGCQKDRDMVYSPLPLFLDGGHPGRCWQRKLKKLFDKNTGEYRTPKPKCAFPRFSLFLPHSV